MTWSSIFVAIINKLQMSIILIYRSLIKNTFNFFNYKSLTHTHTGENTLHIAIVNEDPAMVKYLLDAGANVSERCCGTFMSPEDQKASRTDNIEHEWVDVNAITNYDGYVYWGEYPLSFAACLGQEECYRLVLARGAE